MTSRALAIALVALTATATLAQAPTARRAGIDPSTFDRSVRPQDDLFQFVNGRWLIDTDIPPDRVSHGAFQEVALNVERDLQAIIVEVARDPRRLGTSGQQITDLYDSMMSVERIDAAGLGGARRQLDRIRSITTKSALAREAGVLSSTGNGGPFDADLGTEPDRGSLVVRVQPGGMLLATPDHYLAATPRDRALRTAYAAYLTQLFTLIGTANPAAAAESVVGFETALARARLARESTAAISDARHTPRQLLSVMPGFDWLAWAAPQGIDRVLVLTQPSFFTAFAALVDRTPLDTLKDWLATRYLTSVAPYIAEPFATARFNLFGRVVTGQELPTERWRRAVSLVSGYLGDAIGRLYVERHLPVSTKLKVHKLVDHIVNSYREKVMASRWLSDNAKKEAVRKLNRLNIEVGHPQVWRSYRMYDVRKGDLLGNVERGRRHETAFRMSMARGVADRRHWAITPQTVIASYSPAANQLIIPAAVIQPPFFDPDADDAVNFGALGAIIGHEIAHALDDRGRLFDASGRVRDWWSPSDVEQYARLAEVLVQQFQTYEPVSGARVNGLQTMRENVNDLAGLSVAYAAYRVARGPGAGPIIDGLTGDQRFFLGWARVWRSKERDDYLRQWVATLTYAPPRFRVNGIVGHIPGFYEAFGVSAADRLHRTPLERVQVW